MNKKRTLLTVVALILVCVLSVMGTLAYLEATSNTVTNTFVAAGGPGPFIDEEKDPTTGEVIKRLFEIKEYEVDVTAAGKYFLKNSAEEGAEPVYTEIDGGYKYEKVMPGVTLPKQAFVKLSRSATEITVSGDTTTTKTVDPAPAYLYLEVIGTSPVVEETGAAVYTWEIDDAYWMELKDAEGNAITGPNGGKMYLYKGSDNTHVVTTIAAYNDNHINIIKDNKVDVADVTLPEGEFKLEFNAYLSQASTGTTDDPAAVFAVCFG